MLQDTERVDVKKKLKQKYSDDFDWSIFEGGPHIWRTTLSSSTHDFLLSRTPQLILARLFISEGINC